MNRKQLTILLVVLLVVCDAGILVYRHNAKSWEAPAAPSGKVLGNFNLNDVARIVIQTSSATLTIEKKNDKWVVPARDDYPADFARVGDFIQTLWDLKPAEDVQAGPSQLARLELLPPPKPGASVASSGTTSGTIGSGSTGGTPSPATATPATAPAGTGTLIDLQDKDSKRIAALLAGKMRFNKSPQFPDQEGYPVARYVMPADSNPPKISLVSKTLEEADPSPTAWLDKSFIHIDRIQSVTLASGSNQWTLSRDSDASDEWKLGGIKPGESVDQSKVPPFVSTFSSLAFNDVMPAAAKPDGFDTTLTVTTLDHFIYTLKFGKPDGENLPMSISVTANLPKERTPGKNETSDEKKRLDEEFAANSKKLADALAKDKTYESRIYLMPKTTFDEIFKSRADLLAPPAPAPSPSPAASHASPSATPSPAKASPSPKHTPKKSNSPA